MDKCVMCEARGVDKEADEYIHLIPLCYECIEELKAERDLLINEDEDE